MPVGFAVGETRMRLFTRVGLTLRRQRFGRSWCTPSLFFRRALYSYAHLPDAFSAGRSNAIVRPVSLSHLTYPIPVLVLYVCVAIRQVALERKLKTC